MAKEKVIKKGLKISDNKLELDGFEIRNITGLKIDLQPGRLAEVTLSLLVHEIEISNEKIVKVDNVEIPPTTADVYEKAIINDLVEKGLIDPERI